MSTWSTDPTPIRTESSASLLHNNLTYSPQTNQMAFAHCGAVILMNAKKTPISSEKLKIEEKSKAPPVVLEVKIGELDGNSYVVVATHSGLQIFSADSLKLLHQLDLSEIETGDDLQHFCTGICFITCSPFCVLVGASSGNILVLHDLASSKLSITTTLKGHKSLVNCIDTNSRIVASGDSEGKVLLWDSKDRFVKLDSLSTKDCPVTCMKFNAQGLLIIGLATGHLQVFRELADSMRLCLEISAHSRIINGIDVDGDYVASVGEDCYLNVWEIPDFESKGSSEVKLAQSIEVKNNLLTGVVFMNGSLVTSAFDMKELKKWVLL